MLTSCTKSEIIWILNIFLTIEELCHCLRQPLYRPTPLDRAKQQTCPSQADWASAGPAKKKIKPLYSMLHFKGGCDNENDLESHSRSPEIALLDRPVTFTDM